MNGADETRGVILQTLNAKVERLDIDGGAYAKVTREKVDNVSKCHDTLQHQFSVFMEGMGRIQTSILVLTILTACLAIMAGGTLVWNVVKAFVHI